MEIFNKDMVSIIMLSHNSGKYVEETVRSVLAQTYQNWELLFVDDYSSDDTVTQLMQIKEKDDAQRAKAFDNWNIGKISRFKVVKMFYRQGETITRNSALRDAKGRWISFLNVGDVWSPDKLEKQVAFMEENSYSFSYTQYGLMNKKSSNRGVIISGKEHVTYQDMLRCCWPGYLTVMYDAEKVGKFRLHNTKHNNDYSLWLTISERNDCYLLDENLATMRTPYGYISRFLMTNKLKWRYECYRTVEDLGPIRSFLYTIRNGWYGVVKWAKYVKKV